MKKRTLIERDPQMNIINAEWLKNMLIATNDRMNLAKNLNKVDSNLPVEHDRSK
jgi:hypothetical protein